MASLPVSVAFIMHAGTQLPPPQSDFSIVVNSNDSWCVAPSAKAGSGNSATEALNRFNTAARIVIIFPTPNSTGSLRSDFLPQLMAPGQSGFVKWFVNSEDPLIAPLAHWTTKMRRRFPNLLATGPSPLEDRAPQGLTGSAGPSLGSNGARNEALD